MDSSDKSRNLEIKIVTLSQQRATFTARSPPIPKALSFRSQQTETDVDEEPRGIKVNTVPLSHQGTLTTPSPSIPSTLSFSSPQKSVNWGIHWKEPTYVGICFLGGVILALGHHFYYCSLDGSSAGSPSRQQWALTFGTSFSYLVVHFLGAATLVAYTQYIWTLVRQRAYTIQALDDMFAAGAKAIFNLEMWRHGRLAMFLGIVTWYVSCNNFHVIVIRSESLTNG